MRSALAATAEQVLAFRLARHHLQARLPAGSLIEAAGVCGVQDSPPGSAALALFARVAALTAAAVDTALAVDRTLLQVWSLRGAPYVVPTADAATFTTGLLPADEAELRAFIPGAGPALDRAGLSAADLIARTAAALDGALDGRRLALRPLGVELAARLARGLTPAQRAAWDDRSPYAAGQTLGEALVHFALHAVALQGRFCLTAPRSREARFALTEQWLGRPLPEVDRAAAGAALVRRFLRCYGPSTVGDFAAWAGIAIDQARRLWEPATADLLPVRIGRRLTWLRAEDLPAFEQPPATTSVRLLPPHDPYLDQRDRQLLVPDPASRRSIWRTVGNPGVLLVAGQIAGTWRARKQGRRLRIDVGCFAPVAGAVAEQIEAEARAVASFRGDQPSSLELTLAGQAVG